MSKDALLTSVFTDSGEMIIRILGYSSEVGKIKEVKVVNVVYVVYLLLMVQLHKTKIKKSA